MDEGVPGGPPWAGRGQGRWARLLRLRVWLYLVIILAILSLRLNPAFRRALFGPRRPAAASPVLILAGLDLAPVLIPRLVSGYRASRPDEDVRILGGGTRQALEALANAQADAAFLNRLPSPEERKALSAVMDSVWSYPVALGGIAVLSAREGGRDSLGMKDLKSWFHGGQAASGARPSHFYVPDPNLGLWTALQSAFGLGEEAAVDSVVFLADEETVAKAVAADPASIGFASTFSLIEDLDRLGAKEVRIRSEAGSSAVLPRPGDIAAGDYPLYHYLYLSCRPDPAAKPGAFVEFMVHGRGQRLVERAGYLPARQVARVVQLEQKPVG
jgi:ABC-type phosphate transport system substrate-binding protein